MSDFGRIVPVLRMFDIERTRAFYVDFLGFKIEFEHRFSENFPLYMGLTRGACQLHLSEHHGDATPGSHVRIAMTGLAAFADALRAREFRYAKPGAPERMPWGTIELTLTDPSGNRLTFTEPTEP